MTEPEVKPDIKPEEIISKLDSAATDAADSFIPLLQKISEEAESMEDKENKDILALRKRWANWVLFLIVLIVIFDMVLVTFVGFKIWEFTNTSIVIAVITDNFLKILGLGYLITAEIFKKIYPRK